MAGGAETERPQAVSAITANNASPVRRWLMLIPPTPLPSAAGFGSAHREDRRSPVSDCRPLVAAWISAAGRGGISPAVGIIGRTFDRRRTRILDSPTRRHVGPDRPAERLGVQGRVDRA